MADGPNPDGSIQSINEAAPPVAGATAGAQGAGGAQLEDFSIDSTRKRIAFFLLYIMAAVIALVALVSLVYSANCWFDGNKCTQASQALTLLNTGVTPMFTAMVGLVGSVVGFYFGSRQTN